MTSLFIVASSKNSKEDDTQVVPCYQLLLSSYPLMIRLTLLCDFEKDVTNNL